MFSLVVPNFSMVVVVPTSTVMLAKRYHSSWSVTRFSVKLDQVEYLGVAEMSAISVAVAFFDWGAVSQWVDLVDHS